MNTDNFTWKRNRKTPEHVQSKYLTHAKKTWQSFSKFHIETYFHEYMHYFFDGFMQDCSISIANALEILQSYTKPSIWISL